MNKKLRLLLILGLLLMLWFAISEYRQQQQGKNKFTGTIEVTKADITPKISGYITKLNVKEGVSVSKGQIAAELERKDLAAEFLRDTAALRKAQAQLLETQNGARPQELREAAAKTLYAKTNYNKAYRDFERAKALYKSNAVSKEYLDNAKTNEEAALAQLDSANEQEKLLQAGNREEEIDAAKEELARTKAIATISQSLVADLKVYVPIDGVILTKNFEQGEYVSAGYPIATIANLSDCWVRIYVSSVDLGKIKIGSKAKVFIDAFPGKTFEGYVREISDNAEFTPRQSITKNERANMVFSVKVGINNAEKIMKPGMPADVIFYE